MNTETTEYKIFNQIFLVLGRRYPKDNPMNACPIGQAMRKDPPFKRFPKMHPKTPTTVAGMPKVLRYSQNTMYPRSSLILLMMGMITKADNTTYRAMPIDKNAIF